jgi:hypothetical protein
MVYAMRQVFKRIVSIELSPELSTYAAGRFIRHRHIQIIEGDSAKRIREIVTEISEPCLFWLDAHYSAGVTARGEQDSPIVQELKAILSEREDRDVILIDDARDFCGESGYPTVEEIKREVARLSAGHSVTIGDDIIRIAPATASAKPGAVSETGDR